ncbi:hypothetical protein [Candidatus Nitrosocosmicus sp. SS]|nr:hypothetical protein [Candidatus Nitrosocosmicus sp. SS]MDR4492748.1 hypothetical protein [Candidatus Nitrosocosmicus sp.]
MKLCLAIEDPSQTLKKTSTFEHSLAIKFRKFANKAFGIDLALEDLRPL